jgi:RNA polymerase sigma-70 factor (ECF subfamily)
MPRTGILADVAAGQGEAMEACIAEFGGMVWSLALKMSPSREDAEEGVQEVFIDVWRHATRFDPAVSSEATFVAMIARRRLIDRHRRRASRPPVAPLPASAVAAVPAAAVPSSLEIADEADRIRRCLDRLRPEERRVLELALCEGLTQTAIAERTGLPVGTVKSHARRGLIRLRQLVAENAATSVAIS